ncbi:cytochrome c oxidase subunit II [Halocynthiibacter styelae]|uniref:Cytochrome c oxidase subunit 2 n=1 Tax=Halocynthiibacter styelae TaxID=2761955 RepID=A0A8J7LPY5_9RHOB|nr:cytochrome c oxidase subunit II [Paenihalocynthiibacter styelae]MBI1493487.1 cytochrome c oxidase subunit II [Paenihalocynthiibacter styelae]
MQLKSTVSGFLAAAGAAFSAGAGFAQDADGISGLEVKGAPEQGGIALQEAVGKVAVDTHFLDNMVLWIIGIIVLFVVGLLAVVILKFNQRANKTPATFTHNSPLEIAWTIGPIIVLVFIGAFSLPVLFTQQEIPEGDIHVKVTGSQWYWSYEYIGTDIEFDSYGIGHPATLTAEDTEAGAVPFVLNEVMEARLEAYGYTRDEFLLATDTAVVLPSGKDIVMRITAADVIHSWTIPAFAVKQDAVPGRTAELWFNIPAGDEGVYFGQCSELCGKDHAYMPITVKIVTQEEYDAWIARQTASADLPAEIQVASAD